MPGAPLIFTPSLCYHCSMQYEIRKSVDKNNAYYLVRWSPIVKADKYVINGSVPAMGGIAELYFKDAHGKLNLYMLARSYYGGLRATLRVATDPIEEKDERRRAVLLAHEDQIYYRYALVESQDDMSDVMYFFLSTHAPKLLPPEHSKRYDKIFVKEIDAGNLITI
ncbi:MAG TPA: hypothetical protein DCG47_08190 [Spirochaetaceae bacterium]|nr:hypothetical protein [Spirochaetaceae bacterium]